VKVLVATKETQGDFPGDFIWSTEGELVYPHFICDRDRKYGRDHGCGCGRAMGGLESHKSTTSFKVVEVDYAEDELLRRATESMVDAGWGEDFAPDVVRGILCAAEDFEVGTILGRDLDEVFVRSIP